MLPFQGGTNGKVIADMYEVLRKEGKQQFLKAYWYTAKDKDVPIDAAKKSRNCHSKSPFDSYPLIELTRCLSQVCFLRRPGRGHGQRESRCVSSYWSGSGLIRGYRRRTILVPFARDQRHGRFGRRHRRLAGCNRKQSEHCYPWYDRQ